MGMATGGGGGSISDINVTPLVDVMLVLLIIFMVITPMLQSGVTVNIPEAMNPLEDPAIDKEKGAAEEVDNRLKDKPLEQQIVYIKTDQNVSYGKLVEVINAVRDKGYDRIGLVTEKIREKKAAA